MMNKVIVALDNMTLRETSIFLERAKEIEIIKVGMELFYAHGKQAVLELTKTYGVKVFLDLKLHDIPNTVEKAIKSLEGLPVKFLTIHTVGGREMVKAAMRSKKQYLPDAHILGVSYLTSFSPEDFKSLYDYDEDSITPAFERVFNIGLQENIDGFILSGHELTQLKECAKSLSKRPLMICPGIRFEDEILSGNVQDQKRVMNPSEALQAGADYLVIGRSLTQSKMLEQRIEQLQNIETLN